MSRILVVYGSTYGQNAILHRRSGVYAHEWLFRWFLKLISHRKGLPTDTSRDWDFTEWAEVERFAGALAVKLAPPRAERPGRASDAGHPLTARGSTAAPRSWPHFRI
jgi:hypothetical protein